MPVWTPWCFFLSVLIRHWHTTGNERANLSSSLRSSLSQTDFPAHVVCRSELFSVLECTSSSSHIFDFVSSSVPYHPHHAHTSGCPSHRVEETDFPGIVGIKLIFPVQRWNKRQAETDIRHSYHPRTKPIRMEVSVCVLSGAEPMQAVRLIYTKLSTWGSAWWASRLILNLGRWAWSSGDMSLPPGLERNPLVGTDKMWKVCVYKSLCKRVCTANRKSQLVLYIKIEVIDLSLMAMFSVQKCFFWLY